MLALAFQVSLAAVADWTCVGLCITALATGFLFGFLWGVVFGRRWE